MLDSPGPRIELGPAVIDVEQTSQYRVTIWPFYQPQRHRTISVPKELGTGRKDSALDT